MLVVDDEPMVREVVTRYLERDGHQVSQADNGVDAARWLADNVPDLVVLDVMLPGRDGLDVLRWLRREGEVPVILLTARAEETDRIVGLELGADDYVVKPFSPRELAARVRTVLRRSRSGPASAADDRVIDGNGLTLELGSREVRLDDELVELTPKEFDLLAYLAAHPRHVFTREQLLESVWDSSAAYQDPSTVTVHIRRLRSKIEHDPERPARLKTVWGVGYRFEP